MGELPRLRFPDLSDKRFRATFEKVAVRPESSEAKQLARTIGRLRMEELPTEVDYEVPVMPLGVIVYWGRDVPNTTLRLVYSYSETHLLLIAIHRRA